MARELTWVDDTANLRLVNQYNIQYELVRVPISLIDFVRSEANRGRMVGKIDKAKVARYSGEMIDGDSFPRPILNLEENGFYFILSGNHRCQAARDAGADTIEAYVVRIRDQRTIDSLPIMFNKKHGDNVNKDEVYAVAKHMIDTYKVPMTQAAEDHGVTYNGLRAYMTHMSAMERVQALKINPEKILREHMIKLASVGNANIFRALASLLAEFRLDGGVGTDLIARARDAATEKEGLEAVAETRARLAQERRPGRPRSPAPVRDRLMTQVAGLLRTLNKHQSAKTLQMTDPRDTETVNDQLKAIVAKAVTLFGYPGVPAPVRVPAHAVPVPDPAAVPVPARAQGGDQEGRNDVTRGRSTSHVRRDLPGAGG